MDLLRGCSVVVLVAAATAERIVPKSAASALAAHVSKPCNCAAFITQLERDAIVVRHVVVAALSRRLCFNAADVRRMDMNLPNS